MATCIARCAYLFVLNAEKRIVSRHKCDVTRVKDAASFSRFSFYGTRGTDDAEDIHIPLDRLTVSYSRSSGPGGQHVNKVNTKAVVRFHLHTANWIPEDVRQKLLEKNKNRINKAGELLVTSETSRSQQRNLSDCIRKITAIIAEASEKPRQASAEDIALRAARLENRNKERLKQKKITSAIKNSRRVDFD